MIHLNNSVDVNSRWKKDYSTFASNQNVCHRRVFFFGDYEVGKTSLWLRYMFYDQKRADVGVKRTPHKDGYIFTKTLADGNTNYTMQLWDFLTPLEARQCLNLKIQDPTHARYDAKSINRDYIGNSDVAVLVYDVMKPHTFDWCRTEANQLASWGVKKIIFAGNKSDGDTNIDLDEAA
jgi:GTPase SAR1 family protein